ncbi:hypothetical protein [Actinomadura rupiterrae]|uniref:hypothetical protein n=1 Tax=Actinomadura rupiterrae TaxID=559627 RepID=UPI0020A2A975|nr:hypothetical protein [Actinomadura rupiterrae]MCP2340742.1 hypothetical protein [Actinomadura rupiterrae]
MTPREKRYVLLVGLAWELRKLCVATSVLLPVRGETVLAVHIPGHSGFTVLAAQSEGHWLIMWGLEGTASAETLDLAARDIAAAVRGRAA